MHKKYLIAFLLPLISLHVLFSTNVNIKSSNWNNCFELNISDKWNKIGVKFKNNEFKGLSLLKIKHDNITVQKYKLFDNRYLVLNGKSLYCINFKYPTFEIFSTINTLNSENIDIKLIKLIKDKLTLNTAFYFCKNVENNSFYYDYSNLLYTKNGMLNYVKYKSKFVQGEVEWAFTKYGIFHSSTLSLLINRFVFFVNYKNINELYNLGFEFHHDNCKIKVIDKISEISVYGGQGKKRNFSIDGNLKFEYDVLSYRSILYFYSFHEINYDEFLIKSIKLRLRVRNKAIIDNITYEICINYNDGYGGYLKINNLKFSYNYDKIDCLIEYKIKKDNSSFDLKLSLTGKLEISYDFNL
jgi:hypothetical protein